MVDGQGNSAPDFFEITVFKGTINNFIRVLREKNSYDISGSYVVPVFTLYFPTPIFPIKKVNEKRRADDAVLIYIQILSESGNHQPILCSLNNLLNIFLVTSFNFLARFTWL